MTDTELGLPLEYQAIPEFFDAHNVRKDTARKNWVMETILRTQQVSSVLDLTCGTGSQVFYLWDRGYRVTGADFSPALLEAARHKAAAQGQDITFIDGDMRSLQVGVFDAAITMFNAVGHLSQVDFETAMGNISRNLKPGGVYVFDIYNLDALTRTNIDDLAGDWQCEVNGSHIHHRQHSTLDAQAAILTSFDEYHITTSGEKPRHLANRFSLQIYTGQTLVEMLQRNGFGRVELFDLTGAAFKENASLNILAVAYRASA